MPFSRIATRALIGSLALSLCLMGQSFAGGPIWQMWSRICFTDDLTTEWIVADDKVAEVALPPEKATIYLLVPPIVTRVGDHWEITFDPAGKKKAQLAEHFDNSLADTVRPSYLGAVRNRIVLGMGTHWEEEPWFALHSKNYWAGRWEQPNADRDGTGAPYEYNLDPQDALGIAFIEPVVTEKDGEWIMRVDAAPTPFESSQIDQRYDSWVKAHPGPRMLSAQPEFRYPPKLQQEYDAWRKAVRDWRDKQLGGNPPGLNDFFHLSPEQRKQEAVWERARTAWFTTGGAGPYPQAIDFIQDSDDSAGGGDAPPPTNP